MLCLEYFRNSSNIRVTWIFIHSAPAAKNKCIFYIKLYLIIFYYNSIFLITIGKFIIYLKQYQGFLLFYLYLSCGVNFIFKKYFYSGFVFVGCNLEQSIYTSDEVIYPNFNRLFTQAKHAPPLDAKTLLFFLGHIPTYCLAKKNIERYFLETTFIFFFDAYINWIFILYCHRVLNLKKILSLFGIF